MGIIDEWYSVHKPIIANIDIIFLVTFIFATNKNEIISWKIIFQK